MASDKLFNFLIYENGNLVYSKYNFDFDSYAKDANMKNSSQIEIFENFIKRNETNYFDKLTLKPIFKKYFKPMTQQIQTYVKKWGVIHSVWLNYVGISKSKEYFEQNQFNLTEYDPIIQIQDFLYSETKTNIYTKYNFNFDLYATDFNIPDNKLVIFTDFIFRNYKLSANPKYLNTPYYNLIDGYIVLPEFKKYFTNFTQEICDYISTSAVMSNNLLSDRKMANIDWTKYSLLNPDLPEMNVSDAKKHFTYIGQFMMLKLVFIQPNLPSIEKARKNVCSVYLNNRIDTPIATGYLYKDNYNNYYMITVYHTIKSYHDQRYIYGIFENNSDNNFAAQFRIIGYDIVTDILIGIYDPNLSFNKLYNPNFNLQEYFEIDYSYKPTLGENVYIIGNTGFSDNLTTIKASVMNHNYSGGFNINGGAETIPDSLLLQCAGNPGMSGAPIFKGNSEKSLQIIGMVIGGMPQIELSLVAIDNYIMINVIKSIIQRWNFLQTSNVTDINKIDDFIKNGYPKSWLGIINQYYHPVLANTYKELANFTYIGGLVITNFIIGYNFRDAEYVYTARDLVDLNVIKLDGPLLNTTIYNRFISSGNVPIVIKSIRFFDGITNEPTTSKIGKYGNQVSYSRYIYGNHYTSLNQLSNKNYYNLYTMKFMPIIIEYFYYDGKNWLSDTEIVGSDDSDWYVDYTDNIGNIYHQHKFEYPLILLPYFYDYSIDKYSY
jgi:hypothetical protein